MIYHVKIVLLKNPTFFVIASDPDLIGGARQSPSICHCEGWLCQPVAIPHFVGLLRRPAEDGTPRNDLQVVIVSPSGRGNPAYCGIASPAKMRYRNDT